MASSDSEDEVPLSKRVKAGPGPAGAPGEASAAPSFAAVAAAPASSGATGSSGAVRSNIVPGFLRDQLGGGKPAAGPAVSSAPKPAANGAPAPKPGSSAAAKPGQNGAPKPGGSGKPAAGGSGKPAAGGSGAAAKPAAPKPKAKPAAAAAPKAAAKPANGAQKRPRPPPSIDSEDESEGDDASDSEDDLPLTARVAAKPKRSTAPRPKPQRTPSKRARTSGKGEAPLKWESLRHAGVLFPPEYQPHGVKMLYEGKPVDLTPEQEEVASMYAVMLETDYMQKERFHANFWAGWKQVLGKGHVIRGLKGCDFRPIYEHLMAEREKKKALTREEKLAIKAEKDAAEAKFKVAWVDGRPEGVGNFRVEPPGLFRGRGEHPKMGMVKRRIYPRDITINIGRGEAVPEHPYPGQAWKEVRHDRTVTWLAFWKDSISEKDYKYVWLAANSTFKSDSDLAKYEKARKLKGYVDDIRAMYTRDWESPELLKQQMGVALYFIDSLALRAGHEKDEDEADTVGCCTLKVENVECMEQPANHIKFDFLGKDSIKYENEVEVHPRVWALVKQFCTRTGDGRKKKGEDQLFETMNATDLNNALKDLMDGLSVKVFRTYNASITLDRLLHEESTSQTLDEKKADYDLANKEVAILCNHQRSVPKGHADQMQRLADKLLGAKEELDELRLELRVITGEERASKLKDPAKKLSSEDVQLNRIKKKEEQLGRLRVQERSKDQLKTVALGTSKINYLDPRITIAWCKRAEVPIEKIFNKSLLSKFHWAMEVEPEFRF